MTLLLKTPTRKRRTKKCKRGGAYSEISQDTDFSLKNVPLETYVKHKLNEIGTLNVTLQDTTVGKEKEIKAYAQGTEELANLKFIVYLILHDKEPYYLEYAANPNDYEKFLPEFEEMVKSFRFEN